MSKVKLVKGEAFEIKKGSNYLLVFNQQDISMADVSELNKELSKMGTKCVSVVTATKARIRVIEL